MNTTKRRQLIFIVFCLSVFTAYGQSKLPEYGDVTSAELRMTGYEKDPSAAAVILFDYGSAEYISSSNELYLNVHTRIKILKKSGLRYADFTIRYDRADNMFKSLKAATYNLKGDEITVTEVGRKEWFTEKVDEDRRHKKVAMPDVKVGSVVELQYRVSLGNLGNEPHWYFQNGIPTIHSEFKFDLPVNGVYQPLFQGIIQPDDINIDEEIYHVTMKDVPALVEVPYISTIENFRSKLEFELKAVNWPSGSRVFWEDWKAISNDLYRHEQIGKFFYKKSKVKDYILANRRWGNNEESLKDIYGFVRDHFRWDGVETYFVEKTSKEPFEDGVANSAEINFTLGQFLHSVGIETAPLLLSTREEGYVNEKVPLAKQFNYAIVWAKIGDKEYLLDATERHRTIDYLPDIVINGKGLLIQKSGERWIDLNERKRKSAVSFQVEFEMEEDRMIGKANLVFDQIAANHARAYIASLDEKDLSEEALNELTYDFCQGNCSNVKVEALTELNKPLIITLDFDLAAEQMKLDDKLYLAPSVVDFYQENPFKEENRVYPIEFSESSTYTQMVKFKVPAGYSVEEMPKPQSIALPYSGGRFLYSLAQMGDQVQLMTRLQLSKKTYVPQEYPTLRQLFQLMFSKKDEMIVLSKTE